MTEISDRKRYYIVVFIDKHNNLTTFVFFVTESADVPITYMGFTADRRKFLTGFQNGILRVYPLGDDPEMVFDIDMMQGYFEMNMHDNNYGEARIFLLQSSGSICI